MKTVKKALILAGGYGTRLGKLTKNIPKPMININGYPCLQHIVSHLRKYGVNQIIVKTHYKYDQIVDYFGDSVIYSYEPKLLSEHQTIMQLRDWLKDDWFITMNGDTLTDIDITRTISTAKNAKASLESWDRGVYTGYRICTPNYFKSDQVIRANFLCKWQDIGTFQGLRKARKEWRMYE